MSNSRPDIYVNGVLLIGGRYFVDSRASANIVSENFVKRASVKVNPCEMPMMSVDKQVMCVGICELSVVICTW